jgi:uncharacterized membrane protein YkvA (DUF1232 family)
MKQTLIKKIFVALIGLASFIYLINPTFGIFEIIPDNLPLVGNIDEGLATALLISSLAFFGIDVSSMFGRRNDKN